MLRLIVASGWMFYLNTVEKVQISLKSDKNNGTLHKDQYTFFVISCSVLLRIRNILGKICKENQKTLFVFSKVFFPENRAVNEIMWKNIVEWARSQMNIMAHAHYMLDT
jgi:hypothetical protein